MVKVKVKFSTKININEINKSKLLAVVGIFFMIGFAFLTMFLNPSTNDTSNSNGVTMDKTTYRYDTPKKPSADNMSIPIELDKTESEKKDISQMVSSAITVLIPLLVFMTIVGWVVKGITHSD